MDRVKKNSPINIYHAVQESKYVRKGSGVKAYAKEDNLKAGLAKWLGSESGLHHNIQSELDIITAGQQGITKGAIDSLATYIGVNRKNMAENILSVSVKTLERKDKNTLLDKRTSSHALEIARLMQHGYAVFEDEDRLKFWVNDPNKALSGKKPIELFDTLTGLNMVNDVLTRIEEGVYS